MSVVTAIYDDTAKASNQPMLASFFVDGEPRPKQSFRVSGRGGGFQPARIKAWQNEVTFEAERTMRVMGRFNEPFNTGRLVVNLAFYLGNHRRVDLDNLSKCVLDGLNGIVFGDDQQVYELNLRKVVVGKNERIGVHVSILHQAVHLQVKA